MSLRYNTSDNASGRLQNGINASVTTIPLVSYTSLPATNFIGTLVQYNPDGTVNKFEKIYVSTFTGGVITCTRGFDGSAPQNFNANDYIFLNVVSEIIKDVHLRMDEIQTDVEAKRVVLQNQVDDIYTSGVRRLRVYRLTGDPALQVRISNGAYRVGDVEGQYAGGTVTVGSAATTYIMIDSTGTIQTSTSGWNTNYARLGVVVSSGGNISSITLWKVDAIGGPLSGKGIPDMRSSVIGTPLSYANQAVYGPEFRPQLSGTGVGYLGIPLMDSTVNWWTLTTYGNWTGTGGGFYSTQVAMSCYTADSENYMFIRKGNSDTVWGPWRQVRISGQLGEQEYLSGMHFTF